MKTRHVLVDYLAATLVLAVLPWLLLPLVTFLVSAVESDLSEGAAILLFIALLGATLVSSGVATGAALRIVGGWTGWHALGIGIAASVSAGVIHTFGASSSFLLYRLAPELVGIGVGVAVSGTIRAMLDHVDATPPRHSPAAAARQCLCGTALLLLPMIALVSTIDDASWSAGDVWSSLLHIASAELVAGLVLGLALRRLGKWTIAHSVAIAGTAGLLAAMLSAVGTGAGLTALLVLPLTLGAWLGAAVADGVQAFADSRAALTSESDEVDSE